VNVFTFSVKGVGQMMPAPFLFYGANRMELPATLPKFRLNFVGTSVAHDISYTAAMSDNA
jgi:hypothetical protein